MVRMLALSLAAAALASTGAGAQVTDPAKLNWIAGPPGLPAGAEFAVLSGDPGKEGMFTIRARLPANYVIPPHFHPSDELVTVLSGRMALGMGDTADKAKAPVYGPGGYVVAGAKMNHFVFIDEPTVLQITAHGPFAITYVNAADDPRTKGQ